ncbi:DHA2 family efflux MFS transporter permease subunit [Furfurilactobacillus siliginis]|nr:DHA2 family efflux MFS transporter permease subunit [Furfurilactobacillus siliginis]KRN95968.1 permease of the major facilitator superfamily [Furfurilactobacillus siliginis]
MQEQTTDRVSRKVLLAILGTAILSFCGVLTETSMNVTFPTLMRQLHVTIGTVQWLTTGYLLVAALVMTMASYIHKRFSYKGTFALGIILFVIGLLVCALAPTFSILLLGRLIGGVATGLCIPLMFTIITQFVPVEKLGVYMALGGMIIGFAPALGPTYGGLVSYALGWRMIFWIILPITLIAFVLGFFNIHQKTQPVVTRFDIVGFVLIAVAFITISLGFNNVSHSGWGSPLFWGFILIGVIAVVGYGWWGLHTEHPLIAVTIFKQPTFTLSFLTYLLIQLGNIGLGFLLPNYAQLVLGANAMTAGLILLPGSLLNSILTPISGNVLDRSGAQKPIMWGLVLSCLGMLGFVVVAPHMALLWLVGLYMLFCIGFAFSFSNTLTNGLQQLSPELFGDGNAAFNSIQQYAGSIGTAIMATVLSSSQLHAGSLSMKAATARGAQHDFMIVLAMIVAMLVLATINFRMQKATAK